MGGTRRNVGVWSALLVWGVPLQGALAADVTVTLEPTADTSIKDSEATRNVGAYTEIWGGRSNSSDILRSLILFDIDGELPDNATIQSATLTLTQERTRAGTSDTFELHRLTTAWGEGTGATSWNVGAATASGGGASWNHSMATSTTWPSGAGAFGDVSTLDGSGTVGTGINTAYDITLAANGVTTLQAWLDTPANNHGWLLKANNEAGAQNSRTFFSREDTLGRAPVLEVTYQCPSDGPDADGDDICDSVDLCQGDNAFGDVDGDGFCDDGSSDLCIGDNASGDADGDGYCKDPVESEEVDCDDTEEDAFPGNQEVCDGIDNDCDGNANDESDGDSDGESVCGGDCDDTDSAINTSAAEVCDDGEDNDCDGDTDADDEDCDDTTDPDPDPDPDPDDTADSGDDGGGGGGTKGCGSATAPPAGMAGMLFGALALVGRRRESAKPVNSEL